MHLITLIFAASVLCTLSLLSYLNKRTQKRITYPRWPGPTLLPFIGRIHDLPITFMWLKFKEWAEVYGPIYKTSMLGVDYLIISDENIAEDLLVKRAKYNSDRPKVPSLFDSKHEYLPLMGKNHWWSRQRRYTHANLTQATNAQYNGIMDFEVKRWMYRLITEPDTFMLTLEDMASKVMCTLTWDQHDFSAYMAESAWGLLTQMSPAGPFTNVATPLWRLPRLINPWYLAEEKRHSEQNAFWIDKLEAVRTQMQQGIARPSFMRQYLESKNPLISGDVEASVCIGMMALVGVFTVAGPLNYFLCAMVLHPLWLAKIQEEVDRVCGDRWPSLDDSPDLPALRACIKESMRWKPNVPTGVAHETEADDFYQGWFVPAHTRILPLDWAFLRNPVKYPDSETFRPERWLEPTWPTYQEPLTQYPTIKGMSSFGFGQRQCLGQSVTQDELLIACGTLAWAFNLKHKDDPKTGQKIEIDVEKSNSLLIIKPDPYVMAFEPRSEARRKKVVDDWRTEEERDAADREAFAQAGRKTRELQSQASETSPSA